MSVNPVLAAIIGLLILRQSLPVEAWLSSSRSSPPKAAAALRLHGGITAAR